LFLQVGPSLDFILIFSFPTLLQGFIPQGCIFFQLEDGQHKSFFIIVLLEFNDPLNGLYSINVVLWFEAVIKLPCLNLEATKIISKRPSFSNTSIFMSIIRRDIGNTNGVDIKLPMVRGSTLKSFNSLKLHGELL